MFITNLLINPTLIKMYNHLIKRIKNKPIALEKKAKFILIKKITRAALDAMFTEKLIIIKKYKN